MEIITTVALLLLIVLFVVLSISFSWCKIVVCILATTLSLFYAIRFIFWFKNAKKEIKGYFETYLKEQTINSQMTQEQIEENKDIIYKTYMKENTQELTKIIILIVFMFGIAMTFLLTLKTLL